jgi:pSer/pThr/pTyr-binding forkhead associated (FHA) protein
MPDGSVSSSHCEVALDPAGNLQIRDLGSTNGTFIEGERVREAVARPGQRLKFGNLELIFENSLAAAHTPAMPLPVNLPPPPVPRTVAPEPPPEPVILGEPGPDDCIHHAGILASLLCTRCGKKICAKCTKQQKIGMQIVDFCMGCGGQCKKLSQVKKESEKAAAMPTSFGEAVKKSFKYPLRGNGIILLLIGTVHYALMDWFLGRPIRYLNFYMLIAKVIAFVLGYGYLFAYMQRIVTSSAAGDEDPPEWPEVSDIGQDIIAPFWQLVFAILFAFVPSWFVAGYLGPIPGQFVELLGAIYFPMALLAVAMSTSYTGFNPVFVASSIMKIPKPYFLTCIAFLALEFAWTHLRTSLYEEITIPVLPQLAYWFAYLYVLIVAMRILGMLYFLNRRQLGWGL